MFDQTQMLRDDLDWMLGSEQIPQDILLEALIRDCYPGLIQLGLFILDDTRTAQNAAKTTLANVIVHSYNYSEEIGAAIFIYRLALKTIYAELRWNRIRPQKARFPKSGFISEDPKKLVGNQKNTNWHMIEKLDQQERAIVVLHYLHGWSPRNLSRLFELEAHFIEEILETTKLDFADGSAIASSLLQGDKVKDVLGEILSYRWITPNIDPTYMVESMRQIENLINRFKIRNRAISHFKEILLVIATILVGAFVIWGGNRFFPETGPIATLLRTILVTEYVYIDPMPLHTSTSQQRSDRATPVPEDVLYKLECGQNLECIATEMEISEAELRKFNRIAPGAEVDPKQLLVIPGHLTPEPPQATPVVPVSRPAPLGASLNEYLERMDPDGQRYNTVWIDTLMVNYGPVGYVGPPRILRSQSWFSHDQILIVVGVPARLPDYVALRNDRTLYIARPGIKEPWFSTQLDMTEDYKKIKELNLLLDSVYEGARGYQEAFTSSPSGRGTWAGQPTILTDILDNNADRMATLWIDAQTGLTLREQWYSPVDPQILSQEFTVTNIAYDVDFPQDLFDVRLPWRGGFALDYSGEPEDRKEYRLPEWISESIRQVDPVELEPIQMSSQNYLGGQLLFNYRYNFFSIGPSAQADIYLDRRFIGTSMIGNPWTMICDRSPDGRKIAYVSEPSRQGSLGSELHWLNLDVPIGQNQNLDDLNVTQFAWAPDNDHIAVFGYDKTNPSSDGILIILDIKTKKSRTLFAADIVKSLVWRSDGKRLAMVVRPEPNIFDEQLVVLDPNDGKIHSRMHFIMDGALSNIWPMNNEVVDFPVVQGGLENCSAPR